MKQFKLMFFSLLATWHTGLLGTPFIFVTDKKKWCPLSLEVERGKKFFLGKSAWFIDPSVSLSTFLIIAPSVQADVRIGKTFRHQLSIYVMLGIGSYLGFLRSNYDQHEYFSYMHTLHGMGFSIPNTSKTWSFTMRFVHKYVWWVQRQDEYTYRHIVSCLFGFEWHDPTFYGS